MKLLGDAAVAMWWNVAEDKLDEFHEWHSKEHLPERLCIPGFNRGSRWQREGGGEFFVIYELESYTTLTSDAYRARLNSPTPWSTKMMPLHRDMIRSQCRVSASNGHGIATFMITIRLSPARGTEAGLDAFLRSAVTELPRRRGVTGAHLLRTDTPATLPTKEQQIRGGDAAADWILLLSGHDVAALSELSQTTVGEEALQSNGAATSIGGLPYRLVHVVTPQDVVH
jgi:hypothetical protein